MKRNRILRAIQAALLLATAAGGASAQDTVRLTREDRQALSATAYEPHGNACKAVALISPGAGGSATGYAYLGETLSGLGYLAVVVGHPESGRRALREHKRDSGGMREGLADLITDPLAYRGRFMDLAAARRWAEARCPARPALLVGHSMGAATVMMEAGARNLVGVRGADGYRAYIALSPQGVGPIFPENAWANLGKPVLTITGTRDNELGGASWQTRTEPFRNMPAGCKWLVVINGASHLNLAGNGMARSTEAAAAQAITAFVEGLERGDCTPPRRTRGVDIEAK
jgi:pimeloyl-ACP methyl ester carboxylesterase